MVETSYPKWKVKDNKNFMLTYHPYVTRTTYIISFGLK